MADRSRRISRGAFSIADDEEVLAAAASTAVGVDKDLHEHEPGAHPAGPEDGATGNLFTAILNRWLMSNTFYSSSVNSLRFK